MSLYTDIHSHIMPGVDDGAQSMDESIAMLERAQKEHIGRIILTPHQKPDRKCVSTEGIRKRIGQLTELSESLNINIELFPGSELFYCHELRKKLEYGSLCTLAGSHYVLVEFLPGESWNYIRDGLYDLSSAGYWPIVAHVERYGEVIGNSDRVQELIDMGCYIQVNAGSITGDWGFVTKRTCFRLLKERQVHFIGTDAHRSSGKRAPQMEKCAQVLRKKTGSYADELLWKNAENIFSDIEI